MLQTNSWTCRQSLSAAVLQTNFVCTRSPDRQTLQTNFVCRKSAKTWPKCRQILQTNFACRKSAENWAKMQTNPADKPCQDRKLQAPAEKCRQSLSTIVRKGLSFLDKLCLYPKMLELALCVACRPPAIGLGLPSGAGLRWVQPQARLLVMFRFSKCDK